MNDTERPPRLARAQQIGQRAASLLALPGCSGEVLAVVSGAVYLSAPEEEILWLAQEGAPMHRRCITVSFRPEDVREGLKFTSQGGHLCIADALLVDLGRAAPWEPLPLLPGQRPLLALGALERQLQAILGLVCLLLARGLWQALEPVFCSGSEDVEDSVRGPASPDAVWLDRALPALQRVVRACRARDPAGALEAGLKLVGLGPGLTPSGDDYLGGLLFTAYHLQDTYPQEFCWGKELIRDFLNRARPRTNRLSYTILADLANGHGPEPLHELINSLLRGGPISHSLEDVQRLTGIGHSSGWDMLAGVMTAMALTAGV